MRRARTAICFALGILFALVAHGASVLKPGETVEFLVELPQELRALLGAGRSTNVTTARVAVAVPVDFDPGKRWPIVVISTTSDPLFNSSREMMKYYVKTGLAAGWVVLAADAEQKLAAADDDIRMRYALVSAGLAGLELQWPGAANAPLAFAGYSGGAKHSGWLAAEFASQGRVPAGVFQGGINEETVALAGRKFKTLNDAYRRIPVYLQGGTKDKIATPGDVREVEIDLRRAGFLNLRVEFNDKRHGMDPRPLQKALDWFVEVAAQK